MGALARNSRWMNSVISSTESSLEKPAAWRCPPPPDFRAIAEALGGHCVSLRRTEVGPFKVEEADPERIVPPEEALARIGRAPAGCQRTAR